jgi:hypothetical protein
MIGGTDIWWQMNYAVVVFVFVLLFSSGFWYVHGRHFYTGPGTQSRKNSQTTV